MVIVMSALVAVAAGLSAFAQAGARLAPERAAEAFPLDGGAREAAATARYARTQAKAEDPFIAPSAGVVNLARSAYLREPILPAATVILARDAARSHKKSRTEILEAGHALSRRSTVLNFDLISDYGNAGDADSTLPLIDEILRRETAVHGLLLERLAALAGDPAVGEKILELLALDAPWGPQFWRQLAQSPTGLTNAANLRLAYAKSGGVNDPEVDRLLVEGLAGQARFDDASRLARGLFPSARSLGLASSGGLLRNPRFADKPDILPFDWRLISSGEYGAGRSGDEGGVLISALGGSRGIVMEQLLALPPRRLRLSGSIEPVGTAKWDQLFVSLDCADRPDSTIFSGNASQLPAQIAAPPCRWAWLRVSVRLPSEAEAQEWAVHDISLRPQS